MSEQPTTPDRRTGGTPGDLDVSVVICTRDRAARLQRTLASVRAALDVAEHDDHLEVELVVVDNGSSDATPEMLAELEREDPRARTVREPRPGIGTARRRGVASARGAVVLFTDDDVVVPPTWVVRLSRPLRDGEAEFVSGGVSMAEELRRPWMRPGLTARYYADVPTPPTINPGLVGANLGATRDVLARIPFDEALGTPEYPGAEDVLLYVQALELDVRIRGVGDATVTHHFDPSRLEPAHLHRQAGGYGRCDAYYYHHWLHTRLTVPRTRALVHRLHLALRRATTRSPYDETLVRLIRESAFHQEMLKLRGTPARYEHRGPRLDPSPVPTR